jgi:hypothetical protein
VSITSFGDKPLDEVLVEEDFKRVMPIHPTPAQPGTGSSNLNQRFQPQKLLIIMPIHEIQ